MQIIKVDENGLFIEPVIVQSVPTEEVERTRIVEVEITDEDENTTVEQREETYIEVIPKPYYEVEETDSEGEVVNVERFVTVECPSGFYLPKWNGDEWVEGKPQKEIDEIKAEQRQLQKEQEMKQLRMEQLPGDVDTLGEITVLSLMDNEALAEMILDLYAQIEELKARASND